MKTDKEKSPILSFILSLIIWGLGHLYVGKIGIGIALIIIDFIVGIYLGFAMYSSVGIELCIISLVPTLIIAYDAFRRAKQYNEGLFSEMQSVKHPQTQIEQSQQLRYGMKICVECNREISIDLRFCPYCGYKQSQDQGKFCPHCGKHSDLQAPFCPYCGYKKGGL